MTILGIDTSSRAASCAWMEGGVLIGEFFLNASLAHSQTILPMIDAMLESMGRKAADADVLAVTSGPGSFTGIRIGVAAVKGMAMAMGKPCAAVSALHALALNLRGMDGYLVPVMDARAGQVYTAAFLCEGGELTRLCDDMALSVEQLHERLLPLSAKPITLLGDGAAMCRDIFAGMGLAVAAAPATLLYQRAGSVCVAACELAEDALVDAAALEPFYLRLPQAERERLERAVDS